MLVLTVQKATGAGIVSFSVPVSGRLIACYGFAGGFISNDPNLTGAENTTPLSDGLKTNILFAPVSTAGITLPFENAPEVSVGETLYAAFSGKGTFVLYLQPNP